jgi:hypothetical protein
MPRRGARDNRAAGVRCLRAIAVLCVLLAAAPALRAQEIEPRAYSNAPVGVNFLIAGYVYTQGGLAFDPASPLSEPDLTTSSAVLAYARVLDLWGMSAKFDAILPYTWLTGSALFVGEPVQRDVGGPADPRFRLSVNFFGAPALNLDEFASFEQDLIVGASLQVSVPWGQYDASRLVNIGTNRWFFKPEIGVSKALGPWTLEAQAAVTLYTDNDEFFGGRTRSQDPLYSLQGHAIYSFRSGIWASLDVTYYSGDPGRRPRQRPAAELAGGRHARLPGGPAQLGQAVCEQRRVGAHRQRLRRTRHRLAAPLGRRAVRTNSRARANGAGLWNTPLAGLFHPTGDGGP